MKNTQYTDDAPPLYDTLTRPPAHSPLGSSSEKRPLASALSVLTDAVPSAVAGGAGGAGQEQEGSLWDLANAGSWLEMWRRKQKAEEMRGTLRSLIYDTLRNLSDPGALDVLHSCQHACRPHGISFDELIQEPVEGHPPLYWAILAVCHTPSSSGAASGAAFQYPPGQGQGQTTVGNDILEFLLSVPLTPATVADARAALMLNDANALFQVLRTYATFEKTSYAESVIGLSPASASGSISSPSSPLSGPGQAAGAGAGSKISPVLVQHVSDSGVGTFRVSWSVPVFTKRVKVARRVATQWIARGRAWQCTISIDSGAWVLALKLLKGSAATPVDGLLHLGREGGEKVEVKLRKRKLEPGGHAVEVKLASVPGGATLEYEDSPYLTPEGTLLVQGEFVLERQDSRHKN